MKLNKITKQIEFCYGHRLLNYDGKCKHLHGHNALLEVDVESDRLDERGMVVDFGEVRDIVKKWIDENLDHKMLLCKDDQAANVLIEMGEPIFLMDDNPTAENISKLIWQHIKKLGIQVSEVRLWETPSSCATYHPK